MESRAARKATPAEISRVEAAVYDRAYGRLAGDAYPPGLSDGERAAVDKAWEELRGEAAEAERYCREHVPGMFGPPS